MFDTYVVVEKDNPSLGIGEFVKSTDDLRSFQGQFSVPFHLPRIGLALSTGDTGVPTLANVRLHRTILEMPGGELVATAYTAFSVDKAPSAYMPSMIKSRVILLRSRDGGASWIYAGTIAVDDGRGTEGYGEAVMVRVSHRPHLGRLICLMRTGRELFQSHSDDDGTTWSEPVPVKFPGIDIYAVHEWEPIFGIDPKSPDYIANSDMIGAMVDPDLVEMGNGTLVCSVGFRAPAKLVRKNWRTPRNGDYLAFSCDGGDSWSELVQFRSGKPTAAYTAVREIAPDKIYVLYDENPNHEGIIMGLPVTVNRTDVAVRGR
jgi:hypothetical protein